MNWLGRGALAALVLASAGWFAYDWHRNSTERQLAACKAELGEQLKEALADMRKEAEAKPTAAQRQFGAKLLESFAGLAEGVGGAAISGLQGAEGLAKCREKVALNRARKRPQ